MPRSMLVCLFLAVIGCQESQTVTMPPEEDQVRIDLAITLKPEPEGDLAIGAKATNSGNVAVYFTAGCTSPGIQFRFFDAEGKEAFLFCSCGPLPACPFWIAAMKPGEDVEGGSGFNGQLWSGTAYVPAPSGKYLVQATFRYSPARARATAQSVIAEATFDWKSRVIIRTP
jgi:hypothetical protein